MNTNQIQAVVFDVDGTLVTLRASIGELYSEALGESGCKLSAHALDVAAAEVWSGYEREYLNAASDYVTQPMREVFVWCEFVRRVLYRVAPELATRGDLIADVYNFFSRGRSRREVEGARDVCRQLLRQEIRVIAATNNDRRTKRVLSEMGFSPFVSDVITADDLGWKKPSPKFFHGISARVRLPIQNILHVGNSYHFDVSAAAEAGMHSVLFDPHGRGSAPRISALDELSAYLKDLHPGPLGVD